MYICKNLYLFVGISGINRTISYSFLRISYKNRLPSCILIRCYEYPSIYPDRRSPEFVHESPLLALISHCSKVVQY